jgi:hypothetical protein
MAPHRATAAIGAATLLLAAVAAGCGGGGGTKPATPAPGASAAPAAASPSGSPTPLSQAELEQRLLSLADMPAGYQVAQDTSSSSGQHSTVTSSDPACQPLADLSASGKPPESYAGAQAPQFGASADGPFIDESLASYATPAAAQAYFAKLTTAIQSCKQFTETQPDGTKYDISVSPFSFPGKGDASSASRLSLTVQGQPVQSDAVVVRVGSTLIAVINTNLRSTDSALTQQIVDKAVAKVQNPPAAGSASGSGSGTSAAHA